MSAPEKVLTRPMKKSDYDTIYTLLENGTPREAILAGYPIKLRTLNLRIAKERPELWAKLKSLPTGKQIDVDSTARADAIIKATGRILKVELVEIVGHDISVLAADARAQKAAQTKDPNAVMTPVGLKHARGLLALTKAVSMVPGVGLEGGGGGGVNVNVNTAINHAQVMRRGDADNILADDTDFIDAVVEVKQLGNGED